MNFSRLSLLVMFGICSVLASNLAAADTVCTATVSEANFGDTTPDETNRASATIDYHCRTDPGLSFSGGASVRLCLSLGPGSVAGSTVADRRMVNSQNDLLSYNLYKDAAGTQVWGDTPSGSSSYLEEAITYPISVLSGGRHDESRTFYGRIPVSPALARGDYASTVQGQLIYHYRDRAFGQSTPTSCTSGGVAGTPSPVTFTVRTRVQDRCVLRGATDMDFGIVTSTTTGNLRQTSRITMECTRRTPWQIALDKGENAVGNNRRLRNGSAYITYELNRTAAGSRWGDTLGVDTLQGTGTGAQYVATVHGAINDQPLTAAGKYSDTIKVTVTY